MVVTRKIKRLIGYVLLAPPCVVIVMLFASVLYQAWVQLGFLSLAVPVLYGMFIVGMIFILDNQDDN